MTPYQYMWYAGYAAYVRDSKLFFVTIITTIVAAGICVGIETAMNADDTPALWAFNLIINVVFVGEAIVKVRDLILIRFTFIGVLLPSLIRS